MFVVRREDRERLSPIVWYSLLIYKKSTHIKSILKELGGDELGDFLLTPRESGTALEWLYERELKPYDSLSTSQKSRVLEEIKAKTSKIISISDSLKQSEDASQKELGELLSLAIEFPDLSFVFVDDELNPFIAGWGFRWGDGRSTSGRTLQRIIQKESEIESAKEQSSTQNEDFETTKRAEPEQKKKGINWWIVLLLLLLLLALGAIWYLLSHKEPTTPTPPTEPTPTKQKKEPEPEKSMKRAKYRPIEPDKIKNMPEIPGNPKVVTNRAVIVLKDGASLDSFLEKLKSIGDVEVIFKRDILNTVEVEFKSQESLKKIKALPDILSLELEKVLKKDFSSQDPFFDDEVKSWHLRAVDAFGAWQITEGSPKTVIAVVDSGFDLNHPELRDKTIVMPYNASLGVAGLLGVDRVHGTHVSSLATASIDNRIGGAGLCPGCSLMPIELATPDVEGFSTMSIVRGILYAIDNGADVVNLSLGTSYGVDFTSFTHQEKLKLREEILRITKNESVIFDRLYRYAKAKNVAVVYASGNEDIFVDLDPAKRNRDIILVSAVDKSAKKAIFSNFGKEIDVSASGVDVVSAIPERRFQALSGTSMATPIVSGVIGLMKSLYPQITTQQIKEILKATAKPVETTPDEPIGKLIDAKKALEMTQQLAKKCKEQTPPKQQENPPTTPEPTNPKPPEDEHSMKMPRDSQDVSFSYGLWKSSTPLYNLRTKVPIVHYYSLSPEGSFREIREEGGDSCRGAVTLRWDSASRTLYMSCDKAVCSEDSNKFYVPSEVVCRPNEQSVVICKNREDDAEQGNKKRVVNFRLIKVR